MTAKHMCHKHVFLCVLQKLFTTQILINEKLEENRYENRASILGQLSTVLQTFSCVTDPKKLRE